MEGGSSLSESAEGTSWHPERETLYGWIHLQLLFFSFNRIKYWKYDEDDDEDEFIWLHI